MSSVTFKYPNGIKARCRITGFKGTITARLQLFNGCVQYAVQPACRSDEASYMPDALNLDENNIVVETEEVVPPTFEPESVEFAFQAGDRVRNKINGFEGVLKTRVDDLNGCERYTVEAVLDKDGKQRSLHCFMQELELVPTYKKVEVEQKRTGGPSTVHERVAA